MNIVIAALITLAAPAPQAAVTPPATAQSGPTLLAGASVPLRTTAELTTKGKKLKVGDRFNLEVVDPVAVNGVTVIPAGATAVGEITTIRNKGMFGKSGLIEARLLHVKAGDRNIRLTGRLDDKGSKNGVGAGVATYATLVGGFLITGTSAVIPAGTLMTGYVEEDVPVAFAAGQATSRPLVVPVKP